MTGWTVAQLEDLLVALPPVERISRAQRAASSRRTASAPEGLPRPLRRLLRAEVPARGASSRFLSLVLLSIELALPVEVIYRVLRSHKPSVTKYGARLEERVDALLDKHPHAGGDCLSADCVNAPPGGGGSHEEVRQRVRTIRAGAQQYPWPPRKRLTSLAVLNAHLDMAEKVGSLEYDLDRRRMAVTAGVSRATADKRVHELLAAHWLALAGGDAVPTHSFTYRLVGAPVGPHHPHPLLAEQPSTSQLCGPTSDEADIWRNRVGLGKSRRQTWAALTNDARTVEELAKVTGLTQRTVRQHLVRFNQLGMAGPATEDARFGEWEPYSVDWERLEQHLGVQGYRDRQIERHKRESMQHRHYVQNGGGSWSRRPSPKPWQR